MGLRCNSEKDAGDGRITNILFLIVQAWWSSLCPEDVITGHHVRPRPTVKQQKNPLHKVMLSQTLRLVFPKLCIRSLDWSSATTNCSHELGQVLTKLKGKGLICCELLLKMVACWQLHKGCFCFLCGPQSGPCVWDKMYSVSTATNWAISPLLIPLHLVCSHFIHLQIALRRTVLLKLGTNCTCCICCLSTICYDSLWRIGNSNHYKLCINFKIASSFCCCTWKCFSLNCVSNWKWLASSLFG